MANAALVGLSAQMALRRDLDVVANNIANSNTTGFKADRGLFQEYLSPTARENRFGGGDRPIRFVQDGMTWHDLAQGSIQQTGNPLDVAIDGRNAFLVVQTPNGERYTRAGALQVNVRGQLVTMDGSPVLGEAGPIVFQPLDRNVSITPDGRVSVLEGADNKVDSQRGRIRLVVFANPQQLQKDGANNFAAPAGGAQPAGFAARLVQGAIEKSNVNSVMEITRLMEITRTYTNVANLLQQHNDLRKSAIERLADVPT
jgi:flagellar basal-body rod protein FlgF/flagellar basal-body rod protein FlgG